MSAKKRRNFSGAFVPQDRGHGAWRLSGAAPLEIDVFLRGADCGAAQAFGALPVAHLCIEWDEDTALLAFTSQDGAATVRAAIAIVHEPLQALYDGLPL